MVIELSFTAVARGLVSEVPVGTVVVGASVVVTGVVAAVAVGGMSGFTLVGGPVRDGVVGSVPGQEV